MKKIVILIVINIISSYINITYSNDSEKLKTLVDLYSKEINQITTLDYYIKYEKLLNDIEYKNLTIDEEKINYSIIKWEIDLGKKSLAFSSNYIPFNQHRNYQKNIKIYVQNPNNFRSEREYSNYLKLLSKYYDWIEKSIENFKLGIQNNIVLPKIIVEEMILQFDIKDFNNIEKNEFYLPLTYFSDDISLSFKNDISEKINTFIANDVFNKQKKMYDFLVYEYLPKAQLKVGITNLPDGNAWYEFLIKKYTSTDLTSNEIHKIGLNEIARIKKEMIELKNKMKFKGNFNEFLIYLNTIKSKKYENSESILDEINLINETINKNIFSCFNEVPKSKLEIKRTEAYREQTANPEYIDGNFKKSISGIFYFPIKDYTNFTSIYNESVFLHEAIPGHHYQISLIQENNTIPEFRKNLWYEFYGEGWAFYAESLGTNLGLYTDDLQYFGKLENDMHRALRLVIDTGIHTKNWTFDEAVNYSLQYEIKNKSEIETEIKKYIAIPGLALSYKMGELKIKELKSYSIEHLKDKFSIKEFHHEILSSGQMPLEVLETKIKNWVDKYPK
ncbi:DUF885 domain-containing protein [uncultured Flavobacterium sp.]|uniref:DUF885 domain-containing protein n=1 Tax=uncultured Flavobacterium sp. TaxID=165435 RepID=UPI0030C7DB93